MKYLFYIFGILYLSIACNNLKEKREAAESLLRKGRSLEMQNRTDAAVDAYYKALDLITYTQESELKGKIYNQLGDLFRAQDLFQDAIRAHLNAVEHNKEHSDKKYLSESYRALGKDFNILEKPHVALSYFLKAASLVDQIEDREEVALIHNNLAVTYSELGKYHLSKKHVDKSLQLSNDSVLRDRNYYIKGDLFKCLGVNDSADFYYKLGCMSSNIYVRAGCNAELSKRSRYIGVEKALACSQEYQKLSDSIELMRRTKILEQGELQRSFRQTARNYRLLIGFVCVLGAAIAGFILYRNKKRILSKNLQVEEQDKKLSFQENKIKSLENTLARMQDEFLNIRKKISQTQDQTQTEKVSEAFVQLREKKLSEEESIISTINTIGDICLQNFLVSEIYKKVKEKLVDKNSFLSYSERAELNNFILKVFYSYIRQLSAYIRLSGDDCFLCCLSLSGFSDSQCASCRGVSESAIRSQRSRMKKDFARIFENEALFNKIFSPKRIKLQYCNN